MKRTQIDLKTTSGYEAVLKESFTRLEKYEQFYSVNRFGPSLDFKNRTTYESYTRDIYNGIFELKLVTKCQFYKMKGEIVFSTYDKENDVKLEIIIDDKDIDRLHEFSFFTGLNFHYPTFQQIEHAPITSLDLNVTGKINGVGFEKPRKLTIKRSYQNFLFKFGECLRTNEFDLEIPISILSDELNGFIQKLKIINSTFDESFNVEKNHHDASIC